MGQRMGQAGFGLPIAYSVFFLVLEPISALAGAFFNHFRQSHYLNLLDASSAAVAPGEPVPLATSVAMSQLANMYLFFALNEALVLRATKDINAWRALLIVMLIADAGHLYSMRALGARIYYDVAGWNAGDWGNVPWVYAGATMRICFLMGVGLGKPNIVRKKK